MHTSTKTSLRLVSGLICTMGFLLPFVHGADIDRRSNCLIEEESPANNHPERALAYNHNSNRMKSAFRQTQPRSNRPHYSDCESCPPGTRWNCSSAPRGNNVNPQRDAYRDTTKGDISERTCYQNFIDFATKPENYPLEGETNPVFVATAPYAKIRHPLPGEKKQYPKQNNAPPRKSEGTPYTSSEYYGQSLADRTAIIRHLTTEIEGMKGNGVPNPTLPTPNATAMYTKKGDHVISWKKDFKNYGFTAKGVRYLQNAINAIGCDKIRPDGVLGSYTIKSFCQCFCIQPTDPRCDNLKKPDVTTCGPDTPNKNCVSDTLGIIGPLCPCTKNEKPESWVKNGGTRSCPGGCVNVAHKTEETEIDLSKLYIVKDPLAPTISVPSEALDAFCPSTTETGGPQKKTSANDVPGVSAFDFFCTLKKDLPDPYQIYKASTNAPFCCPKNLPPHDITFKDKPCLSCCIDPKEYTKCENKDQLTPDQTCGPSGTQKICKGYKDVSDETAGVDIPFCPCPDGSNWTIEGTTGNPTFSCPCVKPDACKVFFKKDGEKYTSIADPKTCGKNGGEATHCTTDETDTTGLHAKEICPCDEGKNWIKQEDGKRSCPCTTEEDLQGNKCLNLKDEKDGATCGPNTEKKVCCKEYVDNDPTKGCKSESPICPCPDGKSGGPDRQKIDGKRQCPCKAGEKYSFTKKKCVCDPAQQCCGIKLNTNVPWIGRCIEFGNTNNKDKTWTNDYGDGNTTVTVNILNAFPILMGALGKILLTVILLTAFGMLIRAGVQWAYGDAKAKDIIIKVISGLALIGASGVILHAINPNFFQ